MWRLWFKSLLGKEVVMLRLFDGSSLIRFARPCGEGKYIAYVICDHIILYPNGKTPSRSYVDSWELL